MSVKTIRVTIEVELPEDINDNDINDWVDVEYGEVNGMSPNNPCINTYEVVHREWEVL